MILANFLEIVDATKQYVDVSLRKNTNFRRAFLRAFSALSWPHTGDASTSASDCILSSTSLICSALVVVCCEKQSAVNRAGHLNILHIVVLDENGKCSQDRLERQ